MRGYHDSGRCSNMNFYKNEIAFFLFLVEYSMENRNTFHPFFHTNLKVKLFANLRHLISRNISELRTENLLRYY